MGNTLLETADKYPLKQFDSWVEQKPELSGSKYLFESKIFHTMSFNLKNQNSSIIMKVYLKENDFDSRIGQIYREQFEYIKKRFNPIIYPNVLPFMTLLHFDQFQASQQQSSSSYNFVVVARQMMYLTLSERYLYKPSLTLFDKNWILFQTLIAIYCVHKQENLFHGAIRSSNILLTTSNHVFLTDFANYKPLYIDETNQIRDLRFFYKTHENNSTLAPEKFKNNVEQQLLQLDQIQPKLLKELQSMDIFSLGCFISDLYFEGDQPLFTYEQVQKFKAKQYTPEPIIRKIQVDKIQKLVHKIIMEENEENRIGIEEVLSQFINEIIPDKEKFLFLYCLDITIQSNLLAKPDFRIGFLKEMLPVIHKVIIQQESDEFINSLLGTFKYSLPISLQKIDFRKKIQDAVLNLKFKIWEILGLEMPFYLKSQSMIQKSYVVENTGNLSEKQFRACWENFQNNSKKKEQIQNSQQSDEMKNELNNQQQQQQQKKQQIKYAAELKQIVMLLCTNLRTTQYANSKLVGLELLVHLSEYMSDYDVLHVVLPFVCDQLEDFELQVAEYALQAFSKLLSRLNDPFDNINDTTLYKVFIWTNFQKCAKNMDIHRAFIINSIDLATSCIRLCNISIKKKQKFLEEQMNQSFVDIYSRTQSVIRNVQEEILLPEKQEKEIIELIKEIFKKSLISDSNYDIYNLVIPQMPRFLDLLKDDSEKMHYISYYISCLNKPWVKVNCLENMYEIITKIQDPSQKIFASICLKDCICDQNELVASAALNCCWRLIEKGLLEKQQIFELLDCITPQILHPHNWIRREAVKYIEVLLTKMDPIQVFLEIQPKIIKYMTEDVAILNKDILKLILPKKIDRKYIDYKNKKCTYTDKLGESDIKKYLDLFQQNYLMRQKSSKDQIKVIKDDELKKFTIQFENTKSRQLYKQNFSKKLADFLISAFKQNFLFYLDDIDSKYRFSPGQDEKYIEKLMLDYFMNQKIIFDPSTNCFEINNDLQKFLNQIQMELTYKYDQLMIQFSLFGNHNHKNFANTLVNLSDFIQKLQQFEVQEEIDVGKPFFYDPAANTNTNSLKIWHPQGQLVTTIYEHSDVISNLESINNRYFLSSSYDGTVRIFDASDLEQDFTSDSKAQIVCRDEKDSINNRTHKIKVIKMIPESSSVLVGTEKGTIYLYNIEHCTSTMKTPDQKRRNLQTIYCQGEIRCLESFEKCFLFATSKGEIGVRDIRSKSVALSNNIGKERGLISSMVLAPGFSSETVAIGTLNGYCLLYDIRCNLLSHNYQLLNTNEEPLPIMSLSKFQRYANIDILGDQKDLLAMSYVSDNHEVAMFNLNQQMVDNMIPSMYMLSTDNYNPTIQHPMLKSINKQENFKNCNKNTLKDMMDYDFIPNFSEQVDVLSYLKDPLMTNQNNIKMKWLEQSNNCFQNIKRIQDCKNYVSKIICLPNYSSQSYQSIPKSVQNQIITCGNDRNIRLWPLISDPPSKSNTQVDTQIKGFHISNVDDQQRNFSQKKIADVLVMHEYSRTSFQQSPIYQQSIKKKSQIDEFNYHTFNPNDKRSCHYDTITDMIYLEREQGALLISGSRDKTIKIWK